MSAFPKLPHLAALFLTAALPLAAQEPTPAREPQPRRYQAVAVDGGRVLVIDTATGRCWSKNLGERRWRNEGNPAATSRSEGNVSLPGMKGLPGTTGDGERKTRREPRSPAEAEPLTLTARQRDRAAIPGTNDSLFVHIGDITEGQTLVSVRDADGKTVAGETSLSVNEGLVFEWQDTTYELTLESLTNLLTGEDFAKFRLEAIPHAEDSDRPRTDSGREPPRSDRAAEARKIEALIEHVERMADAKFVRNGIEYDGPTAAAFLRGKWDANRVVIATAADFIDVAATASSTTGQPYLIRPKDGPETKASEYLRAELERLANDPPR